MDPIVCIYTNMKNQKLKGTQRMILFIIELYAMVKRSSFYFKVSSGQC